MSSGVIQKDFNQIFEKNQSVKNYQEKFKFIYNLISNLLKEKDSNKDFKTITNLIIIYLNTPCKKENEFKSRKIDYELSIIIREEFNVDTNECLDMLKIIRLNLLNSPNLTNGEKFDYCCIERYFMKLYLKEILQKM